MKVDNPILKIDAPTDELAGRINQPQGEYHVEDVVADLLLSAMQLLNSEIGLKSIILWPRLLNFLPQS